MPDKSSDVVQGTLDMLVLKTLALEPMHGYGISVRIEQMSKGVFRPNAGSLFLAIQRLQRDELIDGEWKATENNRRAKYYVLTKKGRAVEVVVWLISAPRHRSFVTVTRVKPVIDMAGEVVMAVEPGASSNKHAASKPIGPVVAVWRAVVWSVREVPIGAHGRHSNANGDLRRRRRRTAQHGYGENCENKSENFGHDSSSMRLDWNPCFAFRLRTNIPHSPPLATFLHPFPSQTKSRIGFDLR